MRGQVVDFQRRVAPALEERDAAWFEEQLSKRCPELGYQGKDFKILCPFHPDNSPSLGVDQTTGAFFCFACNAGGGWNALAKKLGMQRLRYAGGSSMHRKRKGEEDEADPKLLSLRQANDAAARALTKMGIKPHKIDKKGPLNQPLVEPWPRASAWRDVPGELLSRLGCIEVNDLRHNVQRIGLPIRTATGELMGFTCRALEPADAEPKYTPLSADRRTWRAKELPAASSLFLIDEVLKRGWTKVVLVEGPYDALRLRQFDVPVVAILGTGNWTSIKSATLTGLGLEAVLVMMDADDSGAKAEGRILKSLKPSMRVKGLAPPAGKKDPGELTARQAAWVKSILHDL